ncbi:Ig-like domain-containing protein [Sphingomonas cannabina]|uniref:BapA/Bap/LapF family large adhesin n=1 Tax=Sphingomonas cannabina TaxID=2899123 RepID=UPI001F42F06B|nr:BapA/Bap/LapF family large adhesin [Sphingomonas cannabina]UIJ44857.1 Ig-like domain-containing protein [Sphingomonas cannabina]
MTGDGEPGATVQIYSPDGTLIGTGTVAADGSYSAAVSPAQTNGERLTVTQTDAAGNVSDPTIALAPDITAPDAPTAEVNDAGTVVTGRGEPGATVTIRDPAGTVIGTGPVGTDGTYTITLTTPQTNGESLTATQADAAGNVSDPTAALAPDLTAPSAPSATVDATGTTVTGEGEAGASITVRDPGGNVIGTGTVDADGHYSVTLTTPQTNGESLSVTQSDAAGNVSDPTTALAPDITAPDAPTADVNDTGTVVTGTGEPGATVEVRDPDGNLIGTGTVDPDGNYTVTLTEPQANGETVTVTQTDPAGNISDPTTALAPDITAPDAPTADVNDTGTVVTGAGEPGATVEVRDPDGNLIGTGTVDPDGNYTVTLTEPQANGETVTVTQTDPAGNISDPTTALAPDITAPDAPTDLAVSDDGTVLTGTGEPGASVEVTDENGAVIGTGAVNPDGSFSVTLTEPQVSGETLGVTQTDAAGNESPQADVVAPFDIDAFDNSATAGIDLVPVVTPVDHGDANYLALVSLVGLDLQVLGVPNVAFTVEPGHSLDAVFEYDALANIGVLSDYRVVVQKWDGTQWTSIDGSGQITLLDLGLLDGNAVASEALGPGEYRAFLTFEGTLGLGLLGSLSVTGTDSDFTDIASVDPIPASGNVITDAGPGGEVDVVSPATVVHSVTVNGVTTDVTADGTTVTGQFGTLVINLDGSYTYTPHADASAIGQAEQFQYTIRDSDGELETANLTITIGSDDITGAPVANDDQARVDVVYENVVDTIDPTVEFSFNTPGLLGTGSGSDTFTVAANTSSDVTIIAVGGGALSALPTFTITIRDAGGAEVQTITATALANVLGLGAGLSLTVQDLPPGTYTFEVSSSSAVGLPFDTDVYLGQTITHLDDFQVQSTTNAEGNLLDNDVAGSAFTELWVRDGTSFVEVEDGGRAITGLYGTLTISETGDYVYTPQADLPHSASDLIDSFTYQLVSPDGRTETATLQIVLDVSGAGTTDDPDPPTATVAPDGASVTGTGEAGATITARGSTGNVIGTGLVGLDGNYTVALTPPQINGERLTVVQTDIEGNVSDPVTAFAPDITAPDAPTADVNDAGTIVTGTGERGATVTVHDPSGATIGTGTVGPDGTYTVTLTSPQTNGEDLTVTQTDGAGNTSAPATVTAPDSTVPDAPTASIDAAGAVVTGDGEAGATITVRDPGGNVIGTGTVGADGHYSVTLTTPQTNGESLSITQTDPAGNISDPTTALAPDITAPDAPVAAVSPDGTVVTGTGEPGARVDVHSPDGDLVGTGLVGPDGNYTVTLTEPQANGETVTVTQMDPAGNISDPTTTLAPDITAPDAPTGLAVSADGTTLTGTGEPGASVEVTDTAGAAIGTGTVNPDGSFSVTLTPAQTHGEELGVTQVDAVGNVSPEATVFAPVDIDAFDNSATAGIDLVPVVTPVDHGDANYLALVSLVGLDLQVLGVPNVAFTVEPGHSLDAVFEYDALANIGVLSDYRVVVQKWDGTQWTSIDGSGQITLLDLGLLDGNAVASEALGPGEYRAFLTFEGTLGLGLLGSLSVTGTDSDFTDIASVDPIPASGNVITDAGPGGEVDVVSPATVVHSVTVNGVTTDVTADGTTVTGQFGTLVINLDGSYTYTPHADASAIGQAEQFQYTIRDSDGELETANLTITIGSDDITGAPVANDDQAAAGVVYENVVDTIDPAVEFNFNTGPGLVILPSTGSGSDTFTVAANTSSDVTIIAVGGGALSVLPTFTITVKDAGGAVVETVTQVALANVLGLGAGLSLTVDDLEPGTYTFEVSSTNTVGLGFNTNVYLGQTITHFDDFQVASTTEATGDLLDNDVLGSAFISLRVNDGTGFVEVDDGGRAITGLYGTLTVSETGEYSYAPRTDLPHSASDLIDSFTYQLVSPDGRTEAATLDVTIDVSGAGTTGFAAFAATTFGAETADVIELGSLAAAPAEAAGADPSTMASLLYDMFEGRGDLENVLQAYLDEPKDDSTIGADADNGIPNTTEVMTVQSEVNDPLSYITIVDDPERDQINSTHLI